MFLELPAIILVLIKITKCSLVVDSSSQNGVYVTDYCPKMPHCAEGAHVMCMYYNPHSVMGPKCHNAQNVSITPNIATKLLDVTNAVRSKIALGKEKGKGGEYLPRGYGVFRLIWDNELATFAQVLANQCVLRHDLCRASKNFPDPGQTAGLVRFSYPDWIPVSKSGHFTLPGLSDPKLIYAATQTLKSWYTQKNSVTPDMIVSYPNWNLNPNDLRGRLYLEIIHGSATHMGCGISAYTEFAYNDNHAALNYNSVQVICNFSARPHNGNPVYNTTQPTAPGYTVRCGCPPGSDEDEDCLCRENPNITHGCMYLSKCRPLALTEKTPAKVCSENDLDCKDPTVVVLPIFTMEDAPQSKLIKPPEHENTTLKIDDDSMEIFKQFENSLENQHQVAFKQPKQITSSIPRMGAAYVESLNKKRALPRKPRMFREKKPGALIQKRISTKKNSFQNHNLHKLTEVPTLHRHDNAKSSIFTKAKQFHLPNSKLHSVVSSIEHSSKENLLTVHESLTKGIYPKSDNHNMVSGLHDIKKTNTLSTVSESTLNIAEENIMTDGHYWNTNPFKADAKSANLDEIDKKPNNLLHLLDKLEKEIKNIDLRENEKVLIDAKIRKIYGSVIGHENLLSNLIPKANHPSKAEPQTDIRHNNIDDERNIDFDTDYNLDDDYKREPNYNTNFKHLDRSQRHYVDDMNEKDDFKNCAKRNHRLNCKTDHYKDSKNNLIQNNIDFNKYITRSNRYKERIYDNKFDMNHNKFRDGFEEFTIDNDRELNRDHYYEDRPRNHIKTNGLNKNHYHDENIRYDHKASDEETDMKRSRQLHNVEDDVKSRGIYNTANLKSSSRNDERKKHIRRDRYRNTYLADDDLLGPERRKYYQDKLDRLQKRIQQRQNYAHSRKRGGRPMRPMRPTDSINSRSKNLDAPYMPERARFLHGF
ncbi:hypothetical protein K1T71_013672 [Dendrolimus kikuchii]|uniref:Uncharacterized protein n=1 Tax=Dendrolimus kikuchii TaxID=765133 RepID=A0ACC1CH29_9NEOP|nr:hypothetical protein K1T71_013672 [Dendrolimus kikuchii]